MTGRNGWARSAMAFGARPASWKSFPRPAPTSDGAFPQFSPNGRLILYETGTVASRVTRLVATTDPARIVVELLGEGTKRFSELRREIEGISQRMLTLTLRRLERDGLVRRTVHAVVPPQVDYDLTPLGATLLDAVAPLVGWTREHRDEIAVSRAAYDGNDTAVRR